MSSKNKFLKNLVKSTGNKYASIASDGSISDTHNYFDTGSYILNAQFSGSIFGGIPENKVTCLAGDPSTGKTFYALSIAKNFLENHEEANVVYFDTEFAVTTEQLENFGMDMDRFALINVDTIENFRTQATKILKEYEKEIEGNDNPPRLMLAMDSLGQISTNKQVEDIESGSTARDMTKAQLIKGAFSVITHLCGALKVPFVLTNHTYEQIGGMGNAKVPSGGKGMIYAASNIIFLTKSKEKRSNEQVGVIIKSRMFKARKVKESTIVQTRLFFEEGLDKYFGLLDIALKYEIVKKKGNKIVFPDGSEGMVNNIYKNPQKFFTDDVLKQIDEACKKEFLFGNDKNKNWDEIKEELNDDE